MGMLYSNRIFIKACGRPDGVHKPAAFEPPFPMAKTLYGKKEVSKWVPGAAHQTRLDHTPVDY